jgi:predicted component of type VI protein secretion system
LHAQILEHEGDFFVRDLGTQLGTWLNGQPLTQVQRLQHGDQIQIGADRLTFQSTAAPTRVSAHSQAFAAPRLLVRSGSSLGLALRLANVPARIGSQAGLELTLTDTAVAPLHAVLTPAGGGWTLEAHSEPCWLRGQPLLRGRPERLRPDDWLRLGSVDLTYSEAATADAGDALSPAGKLWVDSGPEFGQSAAVTQRALVGSAPTADLRISQSSPQQLEIVLHERAFFVRDIGDGRSMRAGRPLGSAWNRLENGDLLLVGGNSLLRFEET